MATIGIQLAKSTFEEFIVTILDDGGSTENNYIKTAYYTTAIDGDNVIIWWHRKETDRDVQMRALDYNLVSTPVCTSATDLQNRINAFSDSQLVTAELDETAFTDIDLLTSPANYYGKVEINSTNQTEKISTISNMSSQLIPTTIIIVSATAFHFNTVTANNVSADNQIVFTEDFILNEFDRMTVQYELIGGFNVARVTSVNKVNEGRIIMTPIVSALSILNFRPIVIPVDAPGAGKVLIATKCFIKYIYNTLPYSYTYAAISNGSDTFIAEGHLYTRTYFWASTVNLNTDMVEIDSVIANYYENQQMYIISDTDDIGGGDADITFYIEYKILNL